MRNYKTYEELIKVSNEDLLEALEEYNTYYEPKIKIRKMKKEEIKETKKNKRG